MTLIFDGGKVSSGDFLDYLKGMKEFATVLKTAADEEVAQNAGIVDVLTAKAARRAEIRARALGMLPLKTIAAHSVIALKKKEEDGWNVYDHTGKKKLGGPYDSEKDADERIRQVEYFKDNPEPKSTKASEEVFEAISSSDIYNLSRYAMEFSAWSSMKSRACDAYARSINAAFVAIANKTNASLFNVRAVSGVIASPSFPRRALKNLKTGLVSVLAKNINPESKRLIEGMLSDIRLAERQIPEVRNVK